MMFFVELFGGSKNPMNFFCLVAQVTGTGALAAEGVSNSHVALDIWLRFVRGACLALSVAGSWLQTKSSRSVSGQRIGGSWVFWSKSMFPNLILRSSLCL